MITLNQWLKVISENGTLLQLLVQPKFRRSNTKLSAITYISVVTISESLKIWPLSSFLDSRLRE